MAMVNSVCAELTEDEIEAAKAELVETDGEPLETPWHRADINLLIDATKQSRPGRTDYYVGGNMFIYFSRRQARTREYRGPDFFFVKDVDGTGERKYWWVFEEDGRFPDTIIELLSESTAKEDRTTKKDLYERVFRTPEYFCYDPDSRQLEGWRLVNGHYQSIVPNERGWLWSEELGLWVGTWEGTYLKDKAIWLRFYHQDGQLVPTEAEAERQHAEAEHQRAEAEQKRAEDERRRADQEHQRADSLEAEVARLKALLATKGIPAPPG